MGTCAWATACTVHSSSSNCNTGTAGVYYKLGGWPNVRIILLMAFFVTSRHQCLFISTYLVDDKSDVVALGNSGATNLTQGGQDWN